MRRKRRTEITVEAQRTVVIGQSRSTIQAWCAACDQYATMLGAQEAAALTGVTQRTIYRRVEAGEIHFTETSDGLLLLCLNSLTAVKSGK